MDKLLGPRLRRLMASLDKGEASGVTFVKGLAYVVRVVDAEQKSAPRPLAQVKKQIRARLRPLQLKAAVELSTMDVMKGAKVAYR